MCAISVCFRRFQQSTAIRINQFTLDGNLSAPGLRRPQARQREPPHRRCQSPAVLPPLKTKVQIVFETNLLATHKHTLAASRSYTTRPIIIETESIH